VRFALADWPFSEAPIAATASELTADVVIVNVPVVAPPAMVTLAGTEAAALPDVRGTEMPPARAGLLIVTVPVTDPPPTVEVVPRETPVTVGPLTDRVAVFEMLFAEPVMVDDLLVATATVVTVKVAEV